MMLGLFSLLGDSCTSGKDHLPCGFRRICKRDPVIVRLLSFDMLSILVNDGIGLALLCRHCDGGKVMEEGVA